MWLAGSLQSQFLSPQHTPLCSRNLAQDKEEYGGLLVSVSASRLPVPGLNLGPVPPDSVVWGAADPTVILYK